MGQGPSRGLTRSERQDELVKICPLPARVIHRPKTNADGSEIESISNCDFEFPDANCEGWIKMIYEEFLPMSGSGKRGRDLAATYQGIVRRCCGIDVDLQASENGGAKPQREEKHYTITMRGLDRPCRSSSNLPRRSAGGYSTR